MTMDTFCQSPVTTNTQGKNENKILTNERRNTLDILAETLKGLTLHSKINDSVYYNLDEDESESDPKRDPLVATHTSDGKKRKFTDNDTTNGNYPQKLLINRLIPVIILTIELTIADGVAAVRGTAHARHTIALKVIITNTVRSGAHIFQNLAEVNRKDTEETIT